MQLKGLNALVTGGQQGIGAAIAVEFARQGANVAINYLDDEAAAGRVAHSVAREGVRATLVQGDVADLASIDRFVAEADSQLGGLDILVNNAAIFPRAHFLELTPEIWDATLTVNLKGTAFVSQAVAKRMKERRLGGSIICIASGAVQGWERSGHYAASKGGIMSLMRSMAYDLASDKIRANAIAPGITDTAQPRGGYNEEQLASLVAGLPIPRMGRPEEIAAVAAFLASPSSSYMTGQMIHVNGGAFMA